MPVSGETTDNRNTNQDTQPLPLRDMANAIRALSMDAVEAAKCGHPGLPMGAADIATVLYTKFLKIDPLAPDWPDRDRFVLSAGHGSMLQYALHHLLGFKDMTIEEIKNFRQLGARTAGHPEYGHAAGIETKFSVDSGEHVIDDFEIRFCCSAHGRVTDHDLNLVVVFRDNSDSKDSSR